MPFERPFKHDATDIPGVIPELWPRRALCPLTAAEQGA